MDFHRLTDDNFELFAATHYDNPACSGIDEFHEDLNRIVYIKRLLKKYQRTKRIRERLIVNHLIIFANVFGVHAAIRLLFYRINPPLHSELKTFLVYLNLLNPEIENIEGHDLSVIPLDPVIWECLKTL